MLDIIKELGFVYTTRATFDNYEIVIDGIAYRYFYNEYDKYHRIYQESITPVFSSMSEEEFTKYLNNKFKIHLRQKKIKSLLK